MVVGGGGSLGLQALAGLASAPLEVCRGQVATVTAAEVNVQQNKTVEVLLILETKVFED